MISLFRALCKNTVSNIYKEVNAAKTHEKWKINIQSDKSSGLYDLIIKSGLFLKSIFMGQAVQNLNLMLVNIETYSIQLDNKFRFVWITDGASWLTTTRPLREIFNHNDYIFNLDIYQLESNDYSFERTYNEC